MKFICVKKYGGYQCHILDDGFDVYLWAKTRQEVLDMSVDYVYRQTKREILKNNKKI